MIESDYKLLIALIAAMLLSAYAGYEVAASKTDLPEEIKAISRDFTRPDTMIVYQDDKTLHFQFK